MDFGVGGEMQVINGDPPQTNRFPFAPDDTMVSFGGRQGERLSMFITNTTGGAIVIKNVIEIVPQ